MREPLLEKKQYYKDCPGCKVEQAKELNQGVSIKNLLVIWMVVLCSSKQYFNLLFSYTSKQFDFFLSNLCSLGLLSILSTSDCVLDSLEHVASPISELGVLISWFRLN